MDEISDLEYKLISILLDFTKDPESGTIIIKNQTENTFLLENESFFKKSEGDLKGIDSQMLFDLVSSNKKSYLLETKGIKTTSNFKLIGPKEHDMAFVADGKAATGWEAFYRTYPDSTGEDFVSRAGFNDKKDEALIYLSKLHDYLCAEGNLYHLKKIKNTWQVSNIIWLWIA